MPRKTVSIAELNALRRQAVQLRLSGETLSAVHKRVGLSAPTIIAASKAFEQGGWPAVDVKPRGRPRAPQSTAAAERIKTQDQFYSAALTDETQPQTTPTKLWHITETCQWLANEQQIKVSSQTTAKYLQEWQLAPAERRRSLLQSTRASHQQWLDGHYSDFLSNARKLGAVVLWLDCHVLSNGLVQLYAHSLRGLLLWQLFNKQPSQQQYNAFFDALQRHYQQPLALVLPSQWLINIAKQHWGDSNQHCCMMSPEVLSKHEAPIATAQPQNGHNNPSTQTETQTTPAQHNAPLQTNTSTVQQTSTHRDSKPTYKKHAMNSSTNLNITSDTLTHLQRLESESIQIMREVVAEATNPVMLYSIGKDSAVMLHLARKAFYPAVPPFPLLHVDTTWKFQAMYEFRDKMVKDYGFELISHVNPEGLEKGVNPFTHGSALHTDIMKTEGLKQALDKYEFDVAFGGARRDEEKSRAKERIFSFRTAQHRWEPKNQRPELWSLYNTRKQKNESIRVFPISNWTELDIWQYIRLQNIPIVPLYYAAERPVVERDGTLIMVDDERMPLKKGEVPMMRSVRFRTLGCYPLTGAVESTANSLEQIIQEMLLTKTSERQGRMIDHDSAASMEKKKQEGYF